MTTLNLFSDMFILKWIISFLKCLFLLVNISYKWTIAEYNLKHIDISELLREAEATLVTLIAGV